MNLIQIAQQLVEALRPQHFAAPITHVYNPLDYAHRPYRRYIELFGAAPKEVVLLGMNPGPFGMAQTGVPFGDVGMVRDWMGIEERVEAPALEHPKRPVQGFHCPRSEVSGSRLWGWAAGHFGTAQHFAQRFFVANYCPLSFMEESGRNRTPDKLPLRERQVLFGICDRALRQTIEILQPQVVVGVGAFAEARARAALDGLNIGRILHPSPASPRANRGWAEAATAELKALGVALPRSRGKEDHRLTT